LTEVLRSHPFLFLLLKYLLFFKESFYTRGAISPSRYKKFDKVKLHMCDVKWLETLSLSTSYGNVIDEESKPRQLHEIVTSTKATTSYL